MEDYQDNVISMDTAIALRVLYKCKAAADKVRHAGGVDNHSGAISGRSFVDLDPSRPRL